MTTTIQDRPKTGTRAICLRLDRSYLSLLQRRAAEQTIAKKEWVTTSELIRKTLQSVIPKE